MKEQEFNMNELDDEDLDFIAEQIKEGYTSGRMDSGDNNKHISWEINWNVWED